MNKTQNDILKQKQKNKQIETGDNTMAETETLGHRIRKRQRQR